MLVVVEGGGEGVSNKWTGRYRQVLIEERRARHTLGLLRVGTIVVGLGRRWDPISGVCIHAYRWCMYIHHVFMYEDRRTNIYL